MRRVFDRFYRVRRPGQQVRGSGIGLSLVKHIADAHGGRAWAENAPDGGAIVSFSVAYARRAPGPDGGEPTLERPARKCTLFEVVMTAPTGPKTILLVEDDPSLALGLVDALEFEGFRGTPRRARRGRYRTGASGTAPTASSSI